MDELDDFDMDAIIREDEERQAAAAPPAARVPAPPRAPPNLADDDAMWDELMNDLPEDVSFGTALAVPPLKAATAAHPAPDDDEDMWDLVGQLQAEDMTAAESASVATGSESASTARTEANTTHEAGSKSITIEEEWDEMYL